MTSTSSSFTPPRSADPEGFGQVVTLQKRIQKIIHDYKEGVSIFSELIQNADDAGAKRIEFIVDWREHKHEWDIFAGAGLLVFNDAPFTADDFKGIQKIDEGGKGKSLHKTGRFGVGFNTVYNLTDYPSIIGGSYLAWLDPHQDYATGPKPGGIYLLKDLAEDEWMSIYEVGHFQRKITNFKDKTLFRFPFRTSKQAKQNKKRGHFGTEAVTRNNNIKPLLTLLKQAGEELLIFLKSILEIKVREIEANGTEKVLLHIQTLNGDEVNQAHQKILNYPADQSVLNDQCKTDPSQLPVVSYRHTIKTDAPRQTTQSTWRVVHRIGVDPEGQLIEVMEKLEALQEKAVPWGGAAARIASNRSNQIQGKQYCFLPLPKTTGLPIHIHGYWDLDSARRSSTDDEGTGSAKTRSKWNELLAKKVVAIACADLMRDLVEDVGQKNPSQFYALWPLSPAQGITDFKIPFLKAVHQYPVIHSNLGKWVLPTEIYELPPNGQALFEPLTADGVPMASRLVPTEISAAFESAGHPFKTITSSSIREYLKKLTTPLGKPVAQIPRASLQQTEWIVELLKFCLSDGHTDLRDLPLALLQDGTLHRFGQAPSGWIYRATSLQKGKYSGLGVDKERII